jgi:hypothetical protein
LLSHRRFAPRGGELSWHFRLALYCPTPGFAIHPRHNAGLPGRLLFCDQQDRSLILESFSAKFFAAHISENRRILPALSFNPAMAFPSGHVADRPRGDHLFYPPRFQ